MSKLNLFLLFCLATLTLSNVYAAKEEYVIKYGHAALADPLAQSSPAYALVFKTQLEKLSGGRIRVDVYPNGQLGNLRSLVQQVRKGTIQMADISSGIMASLYYPQLEILDMPYVFSSGVTARMVLDTENPFTRKLVEDCAEKTGIRVKFVFAALMLVLK